jgi:gliding motility-associated-like protein
MKKINKITKLVGITIMAVIVTTNIFAQTNLALNKPTQCSSQLSGYESSKAVDGNTSTYWQSANSSPQWINVDLGSVKSFNQIKIFWGSSYAKKFDINISNDRVNWTQVYTGGATAYGWQTINISDKSARYVGIYCYDRAQSWGNQIIELQIFYITSSGSGSTSWTLEGKVKTSAGTPISGATVKIDDWGSTTTDANGYYKFTIKIAAYYTLTASKEGYNTNSVKVYVDSNKWQDIVLTEVATKGNITGYVYETGTNSRISGATVKIDYGDIRTTDSNGNYSFLNLIPAQYVLTVSKTGYKTKTVNVTVTAGNTTTANIALEKEQTETIITAWEVSPPKTFLGKRRAFASTFRMDDNEDPQLQQYGGGHVCASGLRIPPMSDIRACALPMPYMYDTSNTKIIPMTWGDCDGSDIPPIKWKTQVKITYVKTGKSVIATLEDCGPADSAREHPIYQPLGCWIDLTPQVKKDFGVDPLDNIVVDFEVLNDQFNPVNLAFAKNVTASSYYKQSVSTVYPNDGVQGLPSQAVDGNTSTYWSAASSNWSNPNQYLLVDLGWIQNINTISILWGSSYATKYDILLSADGTNWKKISVTNSNGGWDCYGFANQSVRYVKLQTYTQSQSWGVQVVELVVQNRTTTGATISYSDELSSVRKPKMVLTPNNDGINDEVQFTEISQKRALGIIPVYEEIKINIFDLTGKLVTTINSEQWNGKDLYGNNLPSGVYIYQYKIGNEVTTGNILIVK